MSELRRCRGFVGTVQIRRNQVLLRNKASKIALKYGSVDRDFRMQTSISGSISHVTELKAEHQKEKYWRGFKELDYVQEEEESDDVMEAEEQESLTSC